MKKLLLAFIICLTPQIFAYKSQDLTKLQTTCSCPNCDLTNVNLPNFILGDTKTLLAQKTRKDNHGFIVCNLTGANFTGANLSNAYFSPADFGPGIFSDVGKIILKKATFKKANLNGAHFYAVIANDANFAHADLTNAKIIEHASFRNVNFQGATMINLSVSPPMGGCGAFFSGSDFSKANLSNSKLNADFTQANFSNANLMNAAITSCDNQPQQSFLETNFSGADLTNATINGEPITATVLAKAKLCKTKLTQGESNRECE